jgi:hypothetical protein
MNSENGLRAIDETSLPLCSGLYIDVENLHPDGQAVIDALIDGWPPNWPTPSRLNLYTRADQAELWRVWAEHRFGNLQVAAHGTQHFSWSATKNSADIAIAINAISDLVLGRVDNVVVLSDDSDFISLYVAIRDEPGIPRIDNRPPFLWAVTDRKGPLSTTVEQFFPPTHLHIVSGERGRLSRPAAAPVETPRPPQMQSPRPPQMQSHPVAPSALAPVEAPRPPQMQPSSVAPPVVSPVGSPVISRVAPPVVSPVGSPVISPVAPTVVSPVGPPVISSAPLPAASTVTPAEPLMPDESPAPTPGETWRAMARAVVEELPLGAFKSAEGQAVIRKQWPTHQMAKASGGSFGTHFKDRIWPVLEGLGVKIPNSGKKPIQYEMTPEAKEAIAAVAD